MNPDQLNLPLSPRSANDILEERLAVAVEQFNASTDPAERVELHNEISRLRKILGKGGAR